MTPYIQLNKHDPDNGSIGDCYRTALGCILNIPPQEIPNFVEKETWDIDSKDWLATQDYHKIEISPWNNLDTLLDHMEFYNPNIYYLLLGQSVRGVNHWFVCCNDKIVHDPSGRNGYPIGPADNQYYFIEILVPIGVSKL